MAMEFSTRIKENQSIVGFISLSLIITSSALGVQRTALTAYTQELSSLFANYIIIGAAISLASFGFSKAIGNIIGGKYADIIGRSKISRIGVGIVTIGSFILILSNSLWIFIFGICIVGVGIGMLFAASTISLTDIGGPKHRAKSISLMELSVYLGTSIGAIMAGSIASGGNFGAAFVFAALMVLLVNFLAFGIKDTSGMIETEQKPKYLSTQAKLQKVNSQLHVNDEDFAARINRSNKSTGFQDSDDKAGRLRSVTFFLTLLTGLISRISDTAMVIIFPLAIILFGFSPIKLGILTSIFTICWSLGIAMTGALSDKFGRKYPIIVGLLIEVFGLIIIFFFNFNEWFAVLVIGTIIAGFGRGIYFPIPPSVISDLFEPEDRGLGLGIYRFVLDIGYVFGAVLLIIVVDVRGGGTSILSLINQSIVIILIMLIFQAVSVIVFFKDPRPGFKQIREVKNHLLLVTKAIEQVNDSIQAFTYQEIDLATKCLEEAKLFERKADEVLVRMTQASYLGAWKASDAVEMLQYSNKVDKGLGYTLRSMRKLLMVQETLPNEFLTSLRRYGLLLHTLMETTGETAKLINIRMKLAIEQSYEANYIEELLDDIHKELWANLMSLADELKPVNLLLLSQVIDSLEKGANTLEDAAELIRLITYKH